MNSSKKNNDFNLLNIQDFFGDIDIYLFDQILKGRITSDMKICDAGCGYGRNLIYLMRSGINVFGLDKSDESVQYVKKLAGKIAPNLPVSNFSMANLNNISYPNEEFDFIISSAVLHFSQSEKEFHEILNEMLRILKKGGILFARLASTIGIEDKIISIGKKRYHLPDGSERFLVDEAMLLTLTQDLGLSLIDPIKTTNVQDKRCMTTWVSKKVK